MSELDDLFERGLLQHGILDLTDRRSQLRKLLDRLPWSKYQRLIRDYKRARQAELEQGQ